MDLIKSLFLTMGEPDPWGSIIIPLWAAHLTDVEEAWDHAPQRPVLFLPPEIPHSLPDSTLLGALKRALALSPRWCILRPGNMHLTAQGGNFW